jgi:CheY-like chemotaxis protein
LGWDVDVVSTGREALSATRAREYDVVLMDRHMPELDGLEATRRPISALAAMRGR